MSAGRSSTGAQRCPWSGPRRQGYEVAENPRSRILGCVPKLIYSFLASLDGYVADEVGSFDWAVPDEEVVDFINVVQQDVGIYLYGARCTSG